ncbi:unnamed protein product [Paramecium sonneborni]|uniref:WD domain, G-beta repeat protein n=2 Tax=Paramecium sonneborni TaxID=65129 RepID=A0A8S1LVQ4_9CILI|nr:unnamed protein product [Paramecium sonneborni]
MNQKQGQEKCQEHSENIVAINRYEKDFEKRGLCSKCMANRYKKEVMHIQNSIDQIKQTKQILKEDRSNILQSRLENIQKLNESVEQLKNFYIQQFDLIITSINKWTQSIQNIEEDFINKAQSQECYDYQLFVEFITQEQEAQIQTQIDFKIQIQNLLLSLTETDLFKTCQKFLENQSTETILFENAENEDDQELEELCLLCDDHKKQITLFDLSKDRPNQKRIACLRCLDGTINQYTSIQIAHNIWQQVQQKRLEKMNKNSDIFSIKVNNLKDYLQTIQKGYISQIGNTVNQLNNIYKNYSNQVNSKTTHLINTSWKNLSKEEILKIAQDLSQINEYNIIEDPLLMEYNNQDNQINAVIKDTVLSLQECQKTQLNKINGQINNQLSVDDFIIKIKENPKEEDCQSLRQNKSQSIEKSIILESKLRELDLSINFKLSQQQYSQTIQSEFKQQQLNQSIYNLIQNKPIKQNEWCYAIAFNQDNSTILVGSNKQIKVFEFKQEQLKQTQLLSEHSNEICTLNFMKQSNQFISGSYEIIIWSINEKNQWICKQKLNGHISFIRCLILNNDEDLIISCSFDKTIKFWIKQNGWICSQTITDHINSVYGLSMNDSQNKLISCGSDNLILIIEYSSQDKKWSIIQKIKVENYGIRICFINDNIFTFQPYSKEQMHIYELNNTNKQYSKTKDLIVKCGSDGACLFPQQYIKQKCLLVNKNGQNINLIKRKENGDFITQQSIDFGTSSLFGIMSDNGEYLITWDDISKEIQIRKYQEK